LEGSDDIIADLDEAIAQGTNEKQSITQSDDDVIKSLLHSPFIRKEGVVRKKVIAIVGLDNELSEFSIQVEKLKSLGFQIVSIGDTTSSFTNETYKKLSDIPYSVDVVLSHAKQLPHSMIEQLINKQGNVLWVEKLDTSDPVLD